MSKVIGFHKKFIPNAVIDESEFIRLVINKTSGRDVYGFFVTDNEFQELKKHICNDGYYNIPEISYDESEPIKLAVSGKATAPLSKEFLRKVKNGEFISSHEVNVKKLLQDKNIAIRKITLLHKFGVLKFKQ